MFSAVDIHAAVLELSAEPWEAGAWSEAARVVGISIEAPFRSRRVRESWEGWPPDETTDGLHVQYWEPEGDCLAVYAVVEKGFSGCKLFPVKAVFCSTGFLEMTLLVGDLASLSSSPTTYESINIVKGDDGPLQMTKQLDSIDWTEVFRTEL